MDFSSIVVEFILMIVFSRAKGSPALKHKAKNKLIACKVGRVAAVNIKVVFGNAAFDVKLSVEVVA